MKQELKEKYVLPLTHDNLIVSMIHFTERFLKLRQNITQIELIVAPYNFRNAQEITDPYAGFPYYLPIVVDISLATVYGGDDKVWYLRVTQEYE